MIGLRGLGGGLLVLIAPAVFAGALIVTEPPAADQRVAEGQDFATYEKGNAWDMSDQDDVVLAESLNISNDLISGGIYRGDAANADPNVWLHFAGQPSAANVVETGQRFPIDTSVYRYFSARVRVSNTDGSPLSTPQPAQVLYFESEDSIGNVDFGQSIFKNIAPEQWQIVTFDLYTENFAPGPSGSSFVWTDTPLIRALRFDPTAFAGIRFEIDWVRLTAEPVVTTEVSVNWSGTAAPVNVDVIDSNGTAFRVATGVSSGPIDASLSLLPPDDYIVQVEDGSTIATSSGLARVNTAPQLNFIDPDVAGDRSRNYAQVELNDPWDFSSASDVDSISPFNHLTNISYGVGGLTATTTAQGDSSILLNSPVEIDPDFYRMLCYTLEVSGTRDIGAGSVARVLWGTDLSGVAGGLTTSDDIIVQEGLNEYCLGDMKLIPLEGGPNNPWETPFNFIRIDPHEFPAQRDIRLASVVLSPLDAAEPQFLIRWTAQDLEDDATIELFVDQDRDPNNNNEVSIGPVLSEDTNTNYSWLATEVAAGEYEIFARISDGFNEVTRYATGPISVSPDTGVIFSDDFE